MATLVPSGGVNAPSAPQTYGVLDTSGTAVARPFSFTASGTAGGVVVAALHLMDGVTDLGTVQFQFPLGAAAQFASTNAISIPDRGPALDYPSTIVVSGYAGTVSKVSVTISNLAHSYPDDLDIVLVSPSAQKAVLMSDVGGGVAVTNLTVGFDDFAEASLPNGTVLSSGTFKPTDFEPGDLMPLPAPAGPYATTLAALAGGDPNGAWSLYVADDTFGDLGVINGGWSLSLATVGSLSPAAPQLSQPRIPSKGVFSFTLTGQVGGTYVIQASDDLMTWTAVETVTLIGTTYEYQTPSSSAHQFYRAWRAP
jgi:subtilisin-like proprotein convertase family protein